MTDHPPPTAQAFHILVALAGGDLHGYAIMQDVAARTSGQMQLSAGTLYGAIQRLLEQGFIVELRGVAGERRRVYRLTPSGRKAARAEAARLAKLLDQARQYGLAPGRG